jgi:hypothetical protein
MTQQFRIDSESLRDKINTLLPSQNKESIGVDLSGSTTIIPVVDVTETAEGSDFPPSLQNAFSLINVTHNSVSNTITSIVNTPGLYRVLGTANVLGAGVGAIQITDGTTTKKIIDFRGNAQTNDHESFDFIIKLAAGDTLQVNSTAVLVTVNVTTRQLADISGNLINP